MGIEQAREALEQGLNTEATDSKDAVGLAPDSTDTQTVNAQKEERQQQIADLESFERVKFKGKEWSKSDLDRAFMMQSDYTKKTQALAEERKYYDNLNYDLEAVAKNPALAQQFKAIYPEKFHALLGYVSQNQAPPAQNTQAIDPQLIDRLGKTEHLVQSMYNEAREAKIKVHEAEIDTTLSSLEKKYPFADKEAVLSRAISLNEQGQQLTPELWDRIAKSVNDNVQKLADAHYKNKVNEQKQASAKAKDVAGGGGTPSQTPKKETFKEATARAIAELGGKQF